MLARSILYLALVFFTIAAVFQVVARAEEDMSENEMDILCRDGDGDSNPRHLEVEAPDSPGVREPNEALGAFEGSDFTEAPEAPEAPGCNPL